MPSFTPTVKIGRAQSGHCWIIIGAMPTVKCELYETALVIAETIRSGAYDTNKMLYSYWSTP